MSEITFKIDYFSITIWGEHEEILSIFDQHLSRYVGDPVHIGHGHRGYQWWGKALSGVNLYSIPSNEDQHHGHIELKGAACDVIPIAILREMFLYLQDRFENTGTPYRITRLDLAWDHVDVTPMEFLFAIQQDHLRSLTKRSSWKMDQSPVGEEDRISTTVYFGAPSSERRMRVYDKHGFTRVELQLRDERAHKITEAMFPYLPEQWGELGVAHLRDFVEVYASEEKKVLAPWWEALVSGAVRAKMTITDARDNELIRLEKWIVHQVSPALSVIADIKGNSAINALVAYSRAIRGDRYKPLLENVDKLKDREGET